MKTSQTIPDIYPTLKEKFGVEFDDIAITYGDTVYSSTPLASDVAHHESIHIRQQTEYDGGAKAWWDRYLIDPVFRYEQELEAYRAQYQFVCRHGRDRNAIARRLIAYANALSGSMYANVATYQQAYNAIRT